jgi:hypothetical protein
MRMALLLLTLVSSIGCTRPLTGDPNPPRLSLEVRNPSRLSLAGHVVYRHYHAPRRGDDDAWSGGGLPLPVAVSSGWRRRGCIQRGQRRPSVPLAKTGAVAPL